MGHLLRSAGLHPTVTTWGWPFLRLYDQLFLKPVNRRRLSSGRPAAQSPTLRTVAGLGRRRWLVRLVRAVFEIDRLFDGLSWGVGILFVARKPDAGNGSRRRAGTGP